MVDYNIIGKNIKMLRKEQGLSQQQLAVRCCVSRATVIHAEHGKSMTTYPLYLISCGLAMPIDKLLYPHIIFRDKYSSFYIPNTEYFVKINFARWLKSYMILHNLSNEDMAKKLNVNPSAISCYLHSKYLPHLEILKRFSDLKKCPSIWQLLGGVYTSAIASKRLYVLDDDFGEKFKTNYPDATYDWCMRVIGDKETAIDAFAFCTAGKIGEFYRGDGFIISVEAN